MLLNDGLARFKHSRLLREEHQTGAVLALGGKLDAQVLALAAVERVWNREQRARAVAGVDLAAAAAAVLHALEDLQRVLDDAVALSPLEVCNHAHTAVVLFAGRVVQALRLRQPRERLLCCGRHLSTV